MCLLLLIALLLCVVRRRRRDRDEKNGDDDGAKPDAASTASEMRSRSAEYGSVSASMMATDYAEKAPTAAGDADSVVYGSFAKANQPVIYDTTMTSPIRPTSKVEYGGMPLD